VDRESTVVGLVGTLVVGTRGRTGPGEVLVKVRGGSETYLAWSEAPLPRGAAVLVVESRGARTVEVVPWSGNAAAPDTFADS
jgi:membrane protein implicated in regulation of membrane protease activity